MIIPGICSKAYPRKSPIYPPVLPTKASKSYAGINKKFEIHYTFRHYVAKLKF